MDSLVRNEAPQRPPSSGNTLKTGEMRNVWRRIRSELGEYAFGLESLNFHLLPAYSIIRYISLQIWKNAYQDNENIRNVVRMRSKALRELVDAQRRRSRPSDAILHRRPA